MNVIGRRVGASWGGGPAAGVAGAGVVAACQRPQIEGRPGGRPERAGRRWRKRQGDLARAEHRGREQRPGEGVRADDQAEAAGRRAGAGHRAQRQLHPQDQRHGRRPAVPRALGIRRQLLRLLVARTAPGPHLVHQRRQVGRERLLPARPDGHLQDQQQVLRAVPADHLRLRPGLQQGPARSGRPDPASRLLGRRLVDDGQGPGVRPEADQERRQAGRRLRPEHGHLGQDDQPALPVGRGRLGAGALHPVHRPEDQLQQRPRAPGPHLSAGPDLQAPGHAGPGHGQEPGADRRPLPDRPHRHGDGRRLAATGTCPP